VILYIPINYNYNRLTIGVTKKERKNYHWIGLQTIYMVVYKRLGRGNRHVILSCVVWKIRETFPEKDGLYVLYTEE